MSVRLSASMYPAYRNPIQFIIYFANIFPFLWPGLLPLLLYAWCTRGALGCFAQDALHVERFRIRTFITLIYTGTSWKNSLLQ